MKIKHFIPTLAIALLISGCGNVAVPASGDQATASDSTQVESDHTISALPLEEKENTQAETPAEEEVADPNAVTKEELEEFTSLFNTPEYIGFLKKSFRDPSEIDWSTVLANGGGTNVYNVSDEEFLYYQESVDYDYSSDLADFIVIRRAALDKYILKHTGQALNSDKSTLTWTYLDEYDSFYTLYWGTDKTSYTCVSGEKDGNDYTLCLRVDGNSHVGKSADRIVKLTKGDDGLILKSNEIQWEEGCDKTQTFDIDLKNNGEVLRFIAFQGYSSEASFLLIKDGNLVSEGSFSSFRNSDPGYIEIKTITAVGFFDFNADGIKDIVCIGDSQSGSKNIILFQSIDANYQYLRVSGVDENVEKQLGDEFTLNKIKKALLGNNTNGVYTTYNEAYAQVAKLNNMYNYDSEASYALIDGNGDEIPELVISAYNEVSLYTFENGYVHCLMYCWNSGIGGNYTHSYAPGKGIYYNTGGDRSGSIRYRNFLTVKEGKELRSDYVEKTVYFEDTDNNGVPSEDELSYDISTAPSKVYNFNFTNSEMTDEEVKNKIAELSGYEYKTLEGEVSYNELIAVLQG